MSHSDCFISEGAVAQIEPAPEEVLESVCVCVCAGLLSSRLMMLEPQPVTELQQETVAVSI